MLVWWCHDDVAWPQSVRNVWAPCCCWVNLKAKQVQPRTNKVYLMKWPESISHNFPSSSSHRVVSACKNYEILQNKQLEHKSASVSQECAVILFTITWKLCIYHTCWSCSGGLNSFTETDVSQPVAFIEVWSLQKNTKWNGGVLLSSADFLLRSVDVGQTVSEEKKRLKTQKTQIQLHRNDVTAELVYTETTSWCKLVSIKQWNDHREE